MSPPPFLLIFICIKTAAFNTPSQQPPYCPSHLMQLLYSFHSDLCHDLTPAPYFPSPELLPQKRKTPSPLNCLSLSATKEKEETNTRGPKKKTPGGRIGGKDHKKNPKRFLRAPTFSRHLLLPIEKLPLQSQLTPLLPSSYSTSYQPFHS